MFATNCIDRPRIPPRFRNYLYSSEPLKRYPEARAANKRDLKVEWVYSTEGVRTWSARGGPRCKRLRGRNVNTRRQTKQSRLIARPRELIIRAVSREHYRVAVSANNGNAFLAAITEPTKRSSLVAGHRSTSNRAPLFPRSIVRRNVSLQPRREATWVTRNVSQSIFPWAPFIVRGGRRTREKLSHLKRRLAESRPPNLRFSWNHADRALIFDTFFGMWDDEIECPRRGAVIFSGDFRTELEDGVRANVAS